MATDRTFPVTKTYDNMYMSMDLPTILGTIWGDKAPLFLGDSTKKIQQTSVQKHLVEIILR